MISLDTHKVPSGSSAEMPRKSKEPSARGLLALQTIRNKGGTFCNAWKRCRQLCGVLEDLEGGGLMRAERQKENAHSTE
jgi:hypothetical protein